MKKTSTQIELPYYCPELKETFNTINKLSHNVKRLNLTHKEYYDKFINRKLNCFFCNNEGKFLSISKGYRNLCDNKDCISKSRSTNSIEGLMYINGCTEEDALKIKTKNDLIRSKKNKKHTKEKLKENINYTKENSLWCIEYWIKKGYSENEAKEKIIETQKQNGQHLKNKLKNDKRFLKQFKENNNIVFQELSNKEVIMYNENIKNIYMYDYVDFTNKKVIEFNGDYWHCNPHKYNESYNHPLIKKTAKEIWEYDKEKIDFVKNKGYDILVIWENEFKQNRNKVVKKCIDFINKKN